MRRSTSHTDLIYLLQRRLCKGTRHDWQVPTPWAKPRFPKGLSLFSVCKISFAKAGSPLREMTFGIWWASQSTESTITWSWRPWFSALQLELCSAFPLAPSVLVSSSSLSTSALGSPWCSWWSQSCLVWKGRTPLSQTPWSSWPTRHGGTSLTWTPSES